MNPPPQLIPSLIADPPSLLSLFVPPPPLFHLSTYTLIHLSPPSLLTLPRPLRADILTSKSKTCWRYEAVLISSDLNNFRRARLSSPASKFRPTSESISGITTKRSIKTVITKFTQNIHRKKVKYEDTTEPKWPSNISNISKISKIHFLNFSK